MDGKKSGNMRKQVRIALLYLRYLGFQGCKIDNLDSNGNGTGLYDVHSPEIWKDYINPDTELTAYHWNNMWQEYDTSSTGYMMANAGYKGPIHC